MQCVPAPLLFGFRGANQVRMYMLATGRSCSSLS